MVPSGRRRAVRSALGLAGKAIALAAALVLGLALLAVTLVQTPLGRRLVVARVNAALAPLFRGHVQIERLDGVFAPGVWGVDGTVFDPGGRPVLVARRLRADLVLAKLLRSALFDRRGPLVVELGSVTADSVELRLDGEPDGTVQLANAFAPARPRSPGEGGGRAVRVDIRQIAVRHVRVCGRPPGAPQLDIDAQDLRAAFVAAPGVLEADVARVAFVAHGFAGGEDVAGLLSAHARERPDLRVLPDARVSWQGAIGPVGARLEASLVAHRVDVHGQAALGEETASLSGDATIDEAGTVRAEAAIQVHEPGAPALVHLRLLPRGRSHELLFDASAEAADLARVPRLKGAVRGSAKVEARGAMDLRTAILKAEVDAHAHDLEEASTRARASDASLHLEAAGQVAAPRFDASLSARDVVAAGQRVAWAEVQAKGTTERSSVHAVLRGPGLPDVDAAADLQVAGGLTASNAGVRLSRSGQRATVGAQRVVVAGGEVRVTGLRVDGVGEPLTGALEARGGAIRLRAATRGIDLGGVARLAGAERSVKAGRLALDADVAVTRSRAEGRLTADLSHGALDGASEVSAQVALLLQGRAVEGRAHLQAADVGTVDVDAPRLELDGRGPLDRASWRDLFGRARLDARVDLERAAAHVPPDRLPVGRVSGRVIFTAQYDRDGAGDLAPAFRMSLATDRLFLSPRVPVWRDIDGVIVHSAPPWAVEGIDVVADARVDRRTGHLGVVAHLHDREGTLADVGLAVLRLPTADVLRGSERLYADLMATPFDLDIRVPERGLGHLPSLLQQRVLAGRIEGKLVVTGTVQAPRVDLDAVIRHAGIGGASTGAPVNLDVSAGYEQGRGHATLRARSQDQTVATAEVRFDGALERLIAGREGTAPGWTASSRAHFERFPLESVPLLEDRRLAGRVSGDVSIQGVHEDGRADATLSIDDLRVGNVTGQKAQLRVTAGGHVAEATLRIDQPDGSVEARLQGASTWGASLAPTLAGSQPLAVSLSAKSFRVNALQPLVSSALDELDGRLDGDLHLELDPSTRSTRLSGTLALQEGALEASGGGGQLHDLSAHVTLSPDGTITLDRASGAGSAGRFQATGSAHLDGGHLRGAKAVLLIPDRSPIPLDVGGSDLGDVDGRFEVTADEQDGTIQVAVGVPSMRLALPEASSSQAQALGPMADVRLGAHRGNRENFVLVPLDPPSRTKAVAEMQGRRSEAGGDSSEAGGESSAPLTVTTDLADARVTRGRDLKVDLTGRVTAKIRDPVEVSGQIRLQPGGSLQVQGKAFSIDGGTISFTGDPSNPEVVVKASWTAPDGTVVHASFAGPLKTGKVSLSSEPPLSREEIVEVILFGTSGGRQAQTPAETASATAVGTVGGEVAQPINHALSRLGLGAVTARVDTSNSSNPRPEVEVQIARDISVQVGVVLGQPPPGVNPDRTLLTLNWRFLRKWSLSSTVGDAGTTIFDVLWQKRY
jgi:translocation and assembly module TamB